MRKIWARKGTVEKRDFAGLELGPPDISIRNVEEQTYFVVVLFLGGWGGGREGRGRGGGWLGATRPSDTRNHPDRTMLRCLKAPSFVSMTCGPNRWLAHMSVTQRQLPLRHRSSVHPDTTLVCLVRLHLRMQTNLLSFANESVCITMPVFSLQ